MSDADRLKLDLFSIAIRTYRHAGPGIAIEMGLLGEIIDRAVEQAHAELRAEADAHEANKWSRANFYRPDMPKRSS